MDTVKIITFDPSKCKGHYDCEKACSQVHFKDDVGQEHSAIRIIRKTGSDAFYQDVISQSDDPENEQGKDQSNGEHDNDYIMTNCNHCGLCIDMCPVQAINRMPNGSVILNKNICIGCMSCVAFCPRGVMRKSEDRVEPFKCISCGSCVKACPEGALSLEVVRIKDITEEVYARQGVCE